MVSNRSTGLLFQQPLCTGDDKQYQHLTIGSCSPAGQNALADGARTQLTPQSLVH
jgi:hypothetical protein